MNKRPFFSQAKLGVIKLALNLLLPWSLAHAAQAAEAQTYRFSPVSEPGHGTTVRLSLPQIEEPAGEQA